MAGRAQWANALQLYFESRGRKSFNEGDTRHIRRAVANFAAAREWDLIREIRWRLLDSSSIRGRDKEKLMNALLLTYGSSSRCSCAAETLAEMRLHRISVSREACQSVMAGCGSLDPLLPAMIREYCRGSESEQKQRAADRSSGSLPQ